MNKETVKRNRMKDFKSLCDRNGLYIYFDWDDYFTVYNKENNIIYQGDCIHDAKAMVGKALKEDVQRVESYIKKVSAYEELQFILSEIEEREKEVYSNIDDLLQ